jgi:hypothetical protein
MLIAKSDADRTDAALMRVDLVEYSAKSVEVPKAVN